MVHIKLKPTQRIETDFNTSELTDNVVIPQESKDFAREYMTSNLLADEYGMDIMLIMDKEVVYGFDYLFKDQKVVIPEINPSLIFYSNALMSHKNLDKLRVDLLENSPTVSNLQVNLNPKLFGKYFQLAVNCIINSQSAIENFINNSIPNNFEILSENGKIIKKPNIHDKIDLGMVQVYERSFEESFENEYLLIKDLIEMRNDIIHLKPGTEITNTKYKNLFRRVIDFNFEGGILAVKSFVNFYSPNLIEECSCGKEYYYDIIYK